MNFTCPTLRDPVLAVLVLTTLFGAGLEAQRRPARPAIGGQPGVAPAQTTVAADPEVMGLATSADLAIQDLGFNALGEVSFTLRNRGAVPINVNRLAPRAAVPNEDRIRIDVYVNGGLVRSLYEPRLNGRESKAMIAKLSSTMVPRCAESRSLKVVVDPQDRHEELHDDNNAASLQAERPCPDLAIKSIKTNYNDLKTEYVAVVTLINNGNATAPRFGYVATTSNSSAFSALPDLDIASVENLAPGQTHKFTIGSTFSYSKMHVFVLLDRFREVDELNESNNQKEATLP